MKKSILLLTVLTSFAFANQTGETLFDAKCNMCHLKTRPDDMSKLVAPPVMGVMRHVKMTYPTKDKAVEFIADYVLNPSKDKAVCMPGKIQKFGLMPSQKGAVTKEEVEQIANWLYDNFPPKGFRGRGQGRGFKHGGMQQGMMGK